MHRRPRSAQHIGSETSAHFSETCDEDLPRLVTQVTTTIAPTPDRHALPDIHAVLDKRELLPEPHLVDAGYIDAEALVASQEQYQVDLLGPTAKDYRWQAREQNGYALSDFAIDWEHEQARCPQGQTSSSWTPTWTRNQEIIKIKFSFTSLGSLPSPFSMHQGQAAEPVCSAARSPFCRYQPLAKESRPKSSSRSIPSEQGSKEFMPKVSAGWACGGHVTSESLVPIFNML